MVGIHPHLGRKIEGNRESGDPLRKKKPIAPIALIGRSEPRVLAHGPELAPVHVRMNPASERIPTRQFASVIHERPILRARRKDVIPKYAISMGRKNDAAIRRMLTSSAWSV